jgi:hypothetical protein
MPSQSRSFAVQAREHQRRWALDEHVPPEALEQGRAWVLREEFQRYNFFRPNWWQLIAGKEHRWARALTSSQCFGVNLFGPLQGQLEHCRRLVERLLPHRALQDDDTVGIWFEHTPPGAREWLGESGQPTQVDVFLEVSRGPRPVGYVLIEVKFTESGFGACRGWNGRHDKAWLNVGRKRCEDVASVLHDPAAQCWMVQEHKRMYWTLLTKSDSTLKADRIKADRACPFRHGLYQLMRSRVLADELCRRAPGAWAEVVVCRHPANQALVRLKDAVASEDDAFAAFRALSAPESIQDWNAEGIARIIASFDPDGSDWLSWMQRRYFPAAL